MRRPAQLQQQDRRPADAGDLGRRDHEHHLRRRSRSWCCSWSGLDVPQAVVGGVTPMAPAQLATRADGTPAPLQVGDQILAINGTPQHNDFRKIALNTALAKEGAPLEIEVKRVERPTETRVCHARGIGGSTSILMLGIQHAGAAGRAGTCNRDRYARSSRRSRRRGGRWGPAMWWSRSMARKSRRQSSTSSTRRCRRATASRWN